MPRSQLRDTSSSQFHTRDDVQVLLVTFITTVIVAHMAYTHVVCASVHVLFPVRKFLLCVTAFASGKLRVVLKIADQSRVGSHFNSQNTHSQFRNSHFTRAPLHALANQWDHCVVRAQELEATGSQDVPACASCSCPHLEMSNVTA